VAVVYELAEATKAALGARKRLNGMARAQRFIETVGARFVFPNSGPACFLDRDLFGLNDFSSGLVEDDKGADNPFPDQTVFLAYLASNGIHNGRLLIPSSVAELSPAGCVVTTRCRPTLSSGSSPTSALTSRATPLARPAP